MEKIILHIALLLLVTMKTFSASAQDLEQISKQKPVTISGGASFRTLFYSAHGIENRRKPFLYVFTGSPVLTLYGVTVPFYFVYSEQERDFRQPFNQFGMSPSYKWITVHAGYRNINYSPYTLGGHTILGGGVDLTPGLFRLGFIYGRLNRATAVDTTTGSFEPYTYTRMGYAGKIGIGKEDNFFDLSFVKAKDDSSSVTLENNIVDKVTPAENIVFGFSTRLTFFKNFFVEGDGGLSLYTRDIRESSVPESSYPQIITGTLGKFININSTTEFYSAYNFGAGYRSGSFSFKVQYKRIDPDYKTMGAYFCNSDLESITVSPSFSLLKQKVLFSGSLGVQKDNLQNQKEATSKKIIGAANLSLNLTDQLGIDASYVNFSINQKPERIFVSDTFLITQTTRNISITPRYTITNTNVNHVIVLSWNYMDLVDLNDVTVSYNNMKSANAFLNYSINLIPQNVSLYINLNSTKLKTSTSTNGNKGISFGINKSANDSKLAFGFSTSLLWSKWESTTGKILNNGIQTTYRVGNHHSFNANINFIGSYPQRAGEENPSFSEWRGELAYLFNF